MHLRKLNIGARLSLTIQNPLPGDQGLYLLCWWFGTGGSFWCGQFKLQDDIFRPPVNPLLPSLKLPNNTVAITDPTYEDTVGIELGYNDMIFWLEWMRYSAQQYNRSNCYVCANARPHLGTVPLIIPLAGDACILSLFQRTISKDTKCLALQHHFSIVTEPPKTMPHISIYPGNYTCYVMRTSNCKDFGNFSFNYCGTYRENAITYLINHHQSLADVFSLCADMKIPRKLPLTWKGECSLAKVLMPLHIMPDTPTSPPDPPLKPLKQSTSLSQVPPPTPFSTSPQFHSRRRRAAISGTLDPHIYLDFAGVPRGVPNEFLARGPVKAGFESLLPPNRNQCQHWLD
uniref:Uncharacterized protein n=1 Tax=Leptobrachium leishanense TaxID=445787 RepID=A0A8C5P9L3_9ANUR